jgi:pyridoxine 5-phosphate synthase
MDGVALSVNVNKIALLRNSRGRNTPDLLGLIDLCLASGADGITIHPRRDERHIRFSDILPVKRWLDERHPGVELNIECEDHPEIIARVLDARPAQCTLVPVSPGEITSDHGWDLPREHDRLAPVVAKLHDAGVRVSIFLDPEPHRAALAAAVGVDRVELYTGPYAWDFESRDATAARSALSETAAAAVRAGLLVNAGHDLDRHNLAAIAGIPGLSEVSIGHAIISRALEVGLPLAIGEIRAALGRPVL